MPIWRYTGMGSGFLAFLMGTAAPLQFADAQTAGTVGAVNSDASSQPRGGATRTINVGQSVLQNERVTTNSTGTVHIIFNDRSALNVGRNSSIVIDKFVYDPSAGAGEMAISMARGVARFVGGQVSHSSGSTIGTPAATIGVRGGNITIGLAGNVTTVLVHNGAATVTTASGQIVLRAGQQISVTSGGPLSNAIPIDIEQLRSLTRQLASQGSQTGGAARLPTALEAARNQIGIARPSVQTPNFDLPAAGDDLVRGFATTRNQPYPQ